MNKRLTSRYPSIAVAAYGYALGTVLLLLLVIPLRADSAEAWLLRPAGCVLTRGLPPPPSSAGADGLGGGNQGPRGRRPRASSVHVATCHMLPAPLAPACYCHPPVTSLPATSLRAAHCLYSYLYTYLYS